MPLGDLILTSGFPFSLGMYTALQRARVLRSDDGREIVSARCVCGSQRLASMRTHNHVAPRNSVHFVVAMQCGGGTGMARKPHTAPFRNQNAQHHCRGSSTTDNVVGVAYRIQHAIDNAASNMGQLVRCLAERALAEDTRVAHWARMRMWVVR